MSAILGKDGQPTPPPAPEQPAPAQAEAHIDPAAMPDKPMLGIDPAGNLTLFIPLATTNDIFARGMVDVTRTKMLEWYAHAARKQAEAQRQIQSMQQKGAMRRFADKIMGK